MFLTFASSLGMDIWYVLREKNWLFTGKKDVKTHFWLLCAANFMALCQISSRGLSSFRKRDQSGDAGREKRSDFPFKTIDAQVLGSAALLRQQNEAVLPAQDRTGSRGPLPEQPPRPAVLLRGLRGRSRAGLAHDYHHPHCTDQKVQTQGNPRQHRLLQRAAEVLACEAAGHPERPHGTQSPNRSSSQTSASSSRTSSGSCSRTAFSTSRISTTQEADSSRGLSEARKSADGSWAGSSTASSRTVRQRATDTLRSP